MAPLGSIFSLVVLAIMGVSLVALVAFIISDALADRRAVAEAKGQSQRPNASAAPQITSRRRWRRRLKSDDQPVAVKPA